eukprot:COSAG02_NODE_3162_length_7248_cov_147.217793_5_plen_152_part_00
MVFQFVRVARTVHQEENSTAMLDGRYARARTSPFAGLMSTMHPSSITTPWTIVYVLRRSRAARIVVRSRRRPAVGPPGARARAADAPGRRDDCTTGSRILRDTGDTSVCIASVPPTARPANSDLILEWLENPIEFARTFASLQTQLKVHSG